MKISEMIISLASDFIELGKSIDEKQDHLNAVCVAWNISILPKSDRKKALRDFLATYKKNNPEEDGDNIANIEHDMELLIKEKIRMFPNVITSIDHAKITENANEYRIVVASSVKTERQRPIGNTASSIPTQH
jgi:hypothetical protein